MPQKLHLAGHLQTALVARIDSSVAGVGAARAGDAIAGQQPLVHVHQAPHKAVQQLRGAQARSAAWQATPQPSRTSPPAIMMRLRSMPLTPTKFGWRAPRA